MNNNERDTVSKVKNGGAQLLDDRQNGDTLTLSEPLLKERSYVKSLSAGTYLSLRHLWGFGRQLWPLVVLAMIVMAGVSKWMGNDCWVLGTLGMMEGKTASSLLDLPLYLVFAWGLLVVVLLSVAIGQIVFLMHRYAELSYLPAVKPWLIWRDILPFVRRSLIINIVLYAVVCLMAAACLAFLPSCHWALSVFVVLCIVWTLLTAPMALTYVWGDTKLLALPGWLFRHLARYGSFLAILFVAGLMVCLIVLAGNIPSITTSYVGGLSDFSVLIGDGTDIPSYFGKLRALSYALGTFVTLVSLLFVVVPLCFQYGSLLASEMVATSEIEENA